MREPRLERIWALLAMVLVWPASGYAQAPPPPPPMQADPIGINIQLTRDLRRDSRRIVILRSDFFYCYPPTDELFIVPAYFETDFASIPAFARSLINPFGEHAEAAVIHDWLYAVGEPDQRQKADEIFRFAMQEQGVGLGLRNIMYRAVRRGGERAYGQDHEWRFTDPYRPRQAVSQPPVRPYQAVIATTECDTFDQDIDDLRRAHADVYTPRSHP